MIPLCGFCHYRMLELIKHNRKTSGKNSGMLRVANTTVSFFSISILVLVSLQMYALLAYNSHLIQIVIWISYGLGVTNLLFLTYHFFRWFRINKNYLIISYLASIIMITINLCTALIGVTEEQLNDPTTISSTQDKVTSNSSVYDIFGYMYDFTSISSFILLWGSSIILLFHYVKRYGRVLFGFLMLLPVVYFLSMFSPLFSGFFLDLSMDYPVQAQIIYTLILSSGKPIGGFLFGLVFWLTARSINNRQLREYLKIAGCGIMLLFTSNQVMNLGTLDYPPFGSMTTSFVSLAAYLLYIGLYTSSVFVAQDKELRVVLKRSNEKQQNLINQIGLARMDDNLIKTAKNMMNMMQENTGVKLIEEDNYKKYIEEVIGEIKKEKVSKNEGV